MIEVEKTFASVDDFLANRSAERAAKPEKKPAPKPEPVEAQETEPAPEGDELETEIDADTLPAETSDEEPDEANLDGDDEDSEPKSAIAPPPFWDAEGREEFAKLPEEAQKAVLKFEKQRSAVMSRRLEEVANYQRETQAKQQQLAQQLEKVSGFISETDTELNAYDQIDWAYEIAQATTREELEDVQWHQQRFENLKKQRKEAERTKLETDARELMQFHQVQRMKLKKIAPDLDVDKPEGIQRVKGLARFLEANGIDAETQSWMPAEGMALAYDALRYRQMIAGRSKAPAPPKAPAGPTVRPTSGSGSSQTQRLAQLSNKRTLSEDEFLEVRRLARKANKRK